LDEWLEIWNEHSGTHEISKLKDIVNHSSLQFDNQQRLVTEARKAVDTALSAWEQSQTQHSQLLSSRDKWTSTQAIQFAKLLENEVQIRTNLEVAKSDLSNKEIQLSKYQMEYMNNLRKRYHEEQVWTDKWRILSTYGTWGLIGLNSIVFLVSQYMFRQREIQRMKDFEGLLKETLVSNSVALEAAISGSSSRKKNDEVVTTVADSGGEVERIEKEKGGTAISSLDSSSEEKESQHGHGEEQSSTAAAAEKRNKEEEENIQTINASGGKDDGENNIDKEQEQLTPAYHNIRPALLLSTIKSRLVNLNNTQDKTNTIATTAIKQTSSLVTSIWARIQQHDITAKTKQYVEKIDLPSAAFGACVTSVTWLVAMSLSSRRGG
jgi:sensitive to high expression protein 9